MKISKRANSIEPSLSRQLFNLAKNYDDVIDLTLGDPDIVPSIKIRQAASDAVLEGKTKYSANAGLQNLREVIAKNFEKDYGLSVNPYGDVAVTVGGMEALFLALSCLVDDGDEVVIFAPYYVNYKQMIQMCGGVPKIINTSEENNFAVSVEELEKSITDKTVAIIINSPCNPTGTVFSKETLNGIAKIAKKYDLTVISDEVYRTLIYDNKKHESIVTIKDMQRRTLVVDSLSKHFAMTGYRLGYAIGPTGLIANMIKMQENVAACAPLPSQWAGITALEECTEDTFIRDEFEIRRNYIYKAINSIEGLSCVKPQATFYSFVNIAKSGLDCLGFAYQLLEKEHVAVVPGITYGSEYKDYIRIAFTVKVDVLEKAINKIEHFMKTLNEEV